MDTARDRPFWETKALSAMTRAEWESLCDGCGKCCLNKHDGPFGAKTVTSRVACRLLDLETCRCASYEDRVRFVPDCRALKPETIARHDWLPASCAYRRLAEGRGLAWWHPLVSGDPGTVHLAGISIRGRAVSERDLDKGGPDPRALPFPGEIDW